MQGFPLNKIRANPGASALIAGVLAAIVSLEIYWMSGSPDTEYKGPRVTVSGAPQAPVEGMDIPDSAPDPVVEREAYTELEEKMDEDTRSSVNSISPDLATLLVDGDFATLREALLQLAAEAVNAGDKNRLGYILNLLGQISIKEQDLFSAEVYLNEALDIFETLGDSVGSAQVYLQLGRTHLRSRQIARTAGTAYDELQVGRWYLGKSLYDPAKVFIEKAIERNLSISRFGSAASAYSSLAKLHLKQNNLAGARQALFESARLFASAGQLSRAHNNVQLLRDKNAQDWQINDLESLIASNYEEYRNGILQIERARDYRRLYNFYRTQGDQDRAWKFRLLANNSLAQVSRRTLFHRQQGVLAILYNSNDSMDQAEAFFGQARETFNAQGMSELSEETELLNRQIY